LHIPVIKSLTFKSGAAPCKFVKLTVVAVDVAVAV